jgi:hypothetical protein
MPKVAVSPGQIWQDDCYYLDTQTGECRRKFLLILATDGGGDALGIVFTSKPNGLTETPACSLGPPRAGYFVGVPGGVFQKPTWMDFSSLEELDAFDLALHVDQGRKVALSQRLDPKVFCAILRCLLQSDDITIRQARWLTDTAANLHCP